MDRDEERDEASEGLASEGLGAPWDEALGAQGPAARAVGPCVRTTLDGAVGPHVSLAMVEALGALARVQALGALDGALGALVHQVVVVVVPPASLRSTSRSSVQWGKRCRLYRIRMHLSGLMRVRRLSKMINMLKRMRTQQA